VENLSVSPDPKLIEESPNGLPVLELDQALQSAFLRRLEAVESRRIPAGAAGLAPKVVGGQMASQAGDKATQPGGVMKVTVADLLQRNPEGILVKVILQEAVCS